MTDVYLGLGSNLGDREGNLKRALALLAPAGVQVYGVSPVYETEPLGFTAQPRFLNLVCRAGTELAPEELLQVCKGIEERLGRGPSLRNAPRPVDIDILFYGDKVLSTPALTVPHPGLAERAFVLVPLADIAPQLVHPVLRRSAQELLTEVKGREGVVRWAGPPVPT